MTLRRSMACLVLYTLSGMALAEGNCPPGQFPIGGGSAGWSGCAPMYDASMPVGGVPAAPSNLDPSWEFRWGVIVVDQALGKFAGMDGYADPRKATRLAIKQCKKNGGKTCEVLLEYYNQCGVLVAGDTYSLGMSGPVAEEISRRALAQCSEQTANCQVYYAGCSYPVEKTR